MSFDQQNQITQWNYNHFSCSVCHYYIGSLLMAKKYTTNVGKQCLECKNEQLRSSYSA